MIYPYRVVRHDQGLWAGTPVCIARLAPLERDLGLVVGAAARTTKEKGHYCTLLSLQC